MKLAFVGKGGSGKTTLTTSYAKWLIQKKGVTDMLIIDADHNAHMQENLKGEDIHFHHFSWDALPKKKQGMIRTSLPNSRDDLLYFSEIIRGVQLLEIGRLSEAREGSGCYHGQINDIEIFLNHCIDTEEETIISDMTAGTDIFGSSYFAKFDILFGVCEPTQESIGVMQDILSRARKYQIPLYYIINKSYDESDIDYVRHALGEDQYIGAVPQQRVRSIKDMQIEDALFAQIDTRVRNHKKTWNIFEENLRMLHEKNRSSWAKEALEQSTFSYRQELSNFGTR